MPLPREGEKDARFNILTFVDTALFMRVGLTGTQARRAFLPQSVLHRMSRIILLLAFVICGRPCSAGDIDFNSDVRPILSNNCLLCHGPDESGLEAGLRLDNRDIATKPLESGKTAVVPGKPDASELIARISSDDEDVRMPPADHGAKLSAKEIAILRQWIAEGAEYAAHWSYQPLTLPAVPQVSGLPDSNWPKNPIDNFVLSKMSAKNLRPSPEADRYALIRRVFLDLTGLPPTIEEADEFVKSADPKAYDKLVDDLLQRPAFGEHWARTWLDLARYADSAGYADDPPRTIWAYRDWVIRAYNDNMPFDQFTIEQLAGDLLPDASDHQLIATAFHRNTLTNNEGGTQDEEFRNVAVVDRVNTTMAVWMGTTIGCAQCHNHKYDPITQEEYFRFFAIFNNTQDADRRDESPRIEIHTDEQLQQKTQLQNSIAKLKQIIDTPTPELAASQKEWEAKFRAIPSWNGLEVRDVTRRSKLAATIDQSGAVVVTEGADNDTYTLNTTPVSAASPLKFSALRLETLPHDALPAKGSGLGGGNFVLTGVKAQFVPEGDAAPKARFVRITNNGDNQILSLAEVQVFSAETNIATKGKATQHSTAFDGPPQYAIDGNTSGLYTDKSVTHTDTVSDPWWEVDLGSLQPVERVAIWNRTDNNLHTRLNNFTIQLLDDGRETVWESKVKESPNPSADYSPSNIRNIRFRTAFADYSQPQFEPADVLSGKTGANDGWAIGGSLNVAHQLVFVPDKPVSISDAGTLRITIEQNSTHKNHLLGHFRLSTTTDDAAIRRSGVPAAMLAVLDKAEKRTEEESASLAAYFRGNVAPELAVQRTDLTKAENTLADMKPATSVPVLRELATNRRKTHLQFRGSYLDKGPEVQPGLPAVFHALPEGMAVNRKTLADWLVHPDNALTFRVLVNRYWETIFGRGLVVTSEEFGSQGVPPTHPKLLDWLAGEFSANGRDRKELLRLLVSSATYRQSAKATPESIAADPDNRWLSRGPRIRLSAEMVRDQALAASGLLSSNMYGPPVNPPQPNLGLTAAFGSSTDWKTSAGEDRYRRGIYTTWRRSNPYPSMATFDAPNREVCTVRRNSTNTPLQSLVTLNDPVYVEAAQSLARIALQTESPADKQVNLAFRRCLLRHPTAQETVAMLALYEDSRKQFSDKPAEAMQLATDPLGTLPKDVDVVEAAAMTVVCNVLLNLDEMFLKR